VHGHAPGIPPYVCGAVLPGQADPGSSGSAPSIPVGPPLDVAHPATGLPVSAHPVQQSEFPFVGELLAAAPSTDAFDVADASGHPIVTRNRDSTRRTKQYTYGTVRYNPSRRSFFATLVYHWGLSS
jgi:hypothetical protein